MQRVSQGKRKRRNTDFLQKLQTALLESNVVGRKDRHGTRKGGN